MDSSNEVSFNDLGRNFSGDSDNLYQFQLDGPPAFGEIVPEPRFVTPIIGGMTYFYETGLAAPQGMATPAGAHEEVLKANIKAQM